MQTICKTKCVFAASADKHQQKKPDHQKPYIPKKYPTKYPQNLFNQKITSYGVKTPDMEKNG